MKKVLFVCVGNSARSQIAEAFFNALSPEGWGSSSAGTEPAEKVSSKAIEVMKEAGLDISYNKPKHLTQEMAAEASKIIIIACLDAASCPVFLIKDKSKVENWKIPDPRELPLEEYRKVRELIRERIKKLISDLEPK